jgi:SAM-dependent methyltransferase
MDGQDFTYPEEFYNTRSAEQVLPLLFSMYKPGSVLDVGCGNGSWLQVAEKLGIRDYAGIDEQAQAEGSWLTEKGKFMMKNLQESFDLKRKFDMVFCLEVAEHLPAESAGVLMDSLVLHSDRILFSAAVPGQEGFRHLNEREPAYWQQLFTERGFNTYDTIRPLIWENEAICWWYRQNIFIAERKSNMDDPIAGKLPYLIHPELFRDKIETIEKYRKAVAYFEKEILDAQKRNQSIPFHLKQLIKLIIYGKRK